MADILCVCPSHRDLRELPAVEKGHTFHFHDYASLALEEMTAGHAPAPLGDPEAEIGSIVERFGERVDAVVSTDDYPGSVLAAAVAQALDLPGASPAANLLCQYKYASRCAQRDTVPEATPFFRLLDLAPRVDLPRLAYPLFVKPVKSFFSVGAQRVGHAIEMENACSRWRGLGAFFRPLDILLRRYTGLEIGTRVLLAEALLEGRQATLEGWVHEGTVHVLGVVDSVFFPGSIAFSRFEYPSTLPEATLARMARITRAVLPAHGLDHGFFNIEFIWDPESDALGIVEINPRMSSQFADLFEKVDGTSTYAILLDLALGRAPTPRRRAGRHPAAMSCVLRLFHDAHVVALPPREQVDRLIAQFPDARVEILATEGRALSEDMQDGCSYRYGIVNLGGRDRQEILEMFEHCRRSLGFRMIRTAAPRAGERSDSHREPNRRAVGMP